MTVSAVLGSVGQGGTIASGATGTMSRALGAAAADRIIVVIISAIPQAILNGNSISGVTIDGTPMTLLQRLRGSPEQGEEITVWAVPFPTGTNATIAATNTVATTLGWLVTVVNVTGGVLDSVITASTATASSFSISGIDPAPGGATIIVAGSYAGSQTARTWTNATGIAHISSSADNVVSTAVRATPGPVTVTCQPWLSDLIAIEYDPPPVATVSYAVGHSPRTLAQGHKPVKAWKGAGAPPG